MNNRTIKIAQANSQPIIQHGRRTLRELVKARADNMLKSAEAWRAAGHPENGDLCELRAREILNGFTQEGM